jgi:hypothetical protein
MVVSFDLAVADVMSLYNITIEINQTNQHMNTMSVCLNDILANIQLIAANQIKK